MTRCPRRPAIVSLARFQKERDQLLARGEKLGLRLEASESPELIGRDVHKLALILLHVPYFRDGRAYSWARLLRTRLGYKGEIRVTGHVLKDQVAFFARVGVDSFRSSPSGHRNRCPGGPRGDQSGLPALG